MEVKFKYSQHVDLVFHVLAHMRVNNASNLFSAEYIEKIEEEKCAGDLDLAREIKSLEPYYNRNFERLAMINFLPLNSRGLNELKQILLNYDGFNKDDFKAFINPFTDLLEREAAFYYDYWEKQHKALGGRRSVVESQMERLLKDYQCIFDYFQKSALVYFSLSITRNGRGFSGIENYFSAVVPFPAQERDFQGAFFTLLHEYTHQFTDQLLKAEINMEDGSHDLSENIVMLFDYYLIKSVYSADIKAYIDWFAKISGNDGAGISEAEFLAMVSVPEDIKKNMLDLLDSDGMRKASEY